MPTRLDALVNVTLLYPFNTAVSKLEELSTIRNFHVVSSSTKKAEAVVSMPWAIFKRMFNCNPVRSRKLAIPKPMTGYVGSLIVQRMQVIELKTHA